MEVPESLVYDNYIKDKSVDVNKLKKELVIMEKMWDRNVHNPISLIQDHLLKKFSSVTISQDEVILQLKNGLFFKYNNQFLSNQNDLLKEGCNNRDIEKFMLDHSTTNDVFIDVGANYGYYSIYMSKALNHGIVVSFEPNSISLEEFGKNIELNNCENIVVEDCALGDKKEKCTLYYSDNLLSRASLRKQNEYDLHRQACECTVFDEYVQINKKRIDFNNMRIIKVDIEGAEYRFLLGAKRSIIRYKPIIVMEIFSEYLRYFNNTIGEIFLYFDEISYNICILQNGRIDIISNPDMLPKGFSDIICIPKDKNAF